MYLIGGGGLLVLLIVFFLTRSGSIEDPDPELARIDRLERKKDVGGLTEALSDPQEKVVGRAMVALANVDPNTARQKLEGLLNDPRPGVQNIAVTQYGRVADRTNVQSLVSLYRSSGDPGLKALVAGALGDARGWEGVEVLLPALSDPSPQLRQAAAESIAKIIGVRLNYHATDPPATRQQVIAKLRRDLPNFKKVYEHYWSRHSK